jgi:hypothetical protein
MNKSISTREEEFGITSTVIRKNKAIIKTLGEQKSEEEI